MAAHQACLNIDELRLRARRFLPRGLFEYIDRGTEDETSLRRLRDSFAQAELTPRVLVDCSGRHTGVTSFGRDRPMPFVVAPTAAAGLVRYDGEVLLARAARAAGIPFSVSTQSITSIEAIAEAGAELWFQLYVWRDRSLTHGLLDRVAACGVDTLILTVDTAVSPKREYNRHNGFGVPVTPSLRGALDVARHPAWAGGVLLRLLANGGWPGYAHYPEQFRTRITDAAAHDPIRLCDRVDWTMWRSCAAAGRGASSSRACWRRRTRCVRRRPGSTPSWCPTMAGAISIARPRRSPFCRGSWTRSATG